MAIYTKTGDKGFTKVFDNKTGKLSGVSKSSCQIASIGAIDELNSFLGIVVSESELSDISDLILKIQENLFVINSVLAGGKIKFSKKEVKIMENKIDAWEGSLPVLQNFIFYGGSKSSASIFFARAICRRAERLLVKYSKTNLVDPEVMKYFNRLSDYLFMMARYVNYILKQEETAWRP